MWFGFGGWRGEWHSHPSVLVMSKYRFGRSRSTLETSFSSLPLARLEVEAFAPDVPSSRWTRSAVARCFLQMRLAVGCSDGDSIFPPAPWSFMSSTSSPRSTLSVATAPVASPCSPPVVSASVFARPAVVLGARKSKQNSFVPLPLHFASYTQFDRCAFRASPQRSNFGKKLEMLLIVTGDQEIAVRCRNAVVIWHHLPSG